MVKLMTLLGDLKEECKDILKDVKNYRFIDFGEKAFVMFWWDGKKGIVIPINVDFKNPYYFDIDVGYHTWRSRHKVYTRLENYRRGESNWEIHDAHLRVTVNPVKQEYFLLNNKQFRSFYLYISGFKLKPKLKKGEKCPSFLKFLNSKSNGCLRAKNYNFHK